jgi:hypothetical protein
VHEEVVSTPKVGSWTFRNAAQWRVGSVPEIILYEGFVPDLEIKFDKRVAES